MIGTYISKKLFRPFLYVGEVDSEKYIEISGGDKKILLGIFSMVSFTISGIIFVLVIVDDFSNESDIKLTVFLFLIGCILLLTNKLLNYKKFNIFNREKGLVTVPRQFSKNGFIAPWDEWEASIQLGGTYAGATLHRLWLTHIPSGRAVLLDSSSAGVDALLGLWAFIVQFMDKEGPYPNVPDLADQKNITDGIGSWEEWKLKTKQPGFVDPYFEWKMELENNPELAPSK